MLTNYIKKYPLSLLLTVVVVALSTLPIGAPEFAQDVPLADKWTHMIMYLGVALVVGWEYWRNHRPQPSVCGLLLWGFLYPALLGGVLELVQKYGTTYRSGEWLDFVADSIGAAAGAVIIILPVIRKRYLR